MESNKTSGNIDLMIACVLVFFPLTSSIGKLIPFSINQVLVLLLVLLIILKVLINGKIQIPSMFVILFMIFFAFNGLVLSTELSLNIENCIYWATTILLLTYIWKEKNRVALYEAFQSCQKQILLSTILVIVINFVGLLYGTNYELTGAYKGFMVTSHSMASTMILSIANLTLYKKNSFHVVSVTLLTLFLFASQARTFMLPLAVILYFELRQWITHKTKRRAVIAIMAAVVIMIFPYTSMADKFIETINNPYARDWLSGLTNFRSTLWKGDIDRFAAENWYLKLFGNGFSYTYQLHENLYGVKIWSHNDFFNLLLATGVIGLIGYIYMLLNTILTLHRGHRDCFFSFLFTLMIFGTAFFNGFYLYIAVVFAFEVLAAGRCVTVGGCTR